MDITLKHNELVTAVTDYIGTLGVNLTDKHVVVTLVAGRGTNGTSAVIEINDGVQEDLEPVIKQRAKRGPNKPKSKANTIEQTHAAAKEAAKATETNPETKTITKSTDNLKSDPVESSDKAESNEKSIPNTKSLFGAE